MSVESAAIELVHVAPGRIRLRWRGEGEPCPELLSGLRAQKGVREVNYRPRTQSLVVLHTNGLELNRIRAVARQLKLDTRLDPSEGPANGSTSTVTSRPSVSPRSSTLTHTPTHA